MTEKGSSNLARSVPWFVSCLSLEDRTLLCLLARHRVAAIAVTPLSSLFLFLLLFSITAVTLTRLGKEVRQSSCCRFSLVLKQRQEKDVYKTDWNSYLLYAFLQLTSRCLKPFFSLLSPSILSFCLFLCSSVLISIPLPGWCMCLQLSRQLTAQW